MAGRAYGIDCPDEVVFAPGTWSAGGEYLQRLRLLNSDNRTLHITYRLPRCKLYFMEFPAPFSLAPGTTKTLELRFRPTSEDEELLDYVEITVEGRGSFRVFVRSLLPRLAVDFRQAVLEHHMPSPVPDPGAADTVPPPPAATSLNTTSNFMVLASAVQLPQPPSAAARGAEPDALRGHIIDFGLVPVNEPTPVHVTLENKGQVDAAFAWEVPAPWSVTPTHGVVPVGETFRVTFTLVPTAACLLQGRAVCGLSRAPGGRASACGPAPVSVILPLAATPKYQHLACSVSRSAHIQFSEGGPGSPARSPKAAAAGGAEQGSEHPLDSLCLHPLPAPVAAAAGGVPGPEVAVTFGDVYIRGPVTGPEPPNVRHIVIRNTGPVRATVSIDRLPDSADSVSPLAAALHTFSVAASRIQVEAGHVATVAVTFHPRTCGLHSCERFVVWCPGGNAVTVVCSGTARGPVLFASRRTKTGAGSGGGRFAAAAVGALDDAPASLELTTTTTTTAAPGGSTFLRPLKLQMTPPPHLVPGGTSAGVESAILDEGEGEEKEDPATTAAKLARSPNAGPLNLHSLCFGDVLIGKTASLVLLLTNVTPCPAAFEIVGGETRGAVFSFTTCRGVVKGGDVVEVGVRFAPLVPGNYYRRIVVAVCDGEPTWVDVLGTAYDDKARPFPLRQRHIDAYRLRSLGLKRNTTPKEAWARLTAASREAQRAALGPNADAVEEERDPDPFLLSDHASRAAEAEWWLSHVRTRSGGYSRAGLAAFRGLILGEAATLTDAAPVDGLAAAGPDGVLYEVSPPALDFGACARASLPERRIVYVRNNSATKVTASWMVPGSPFIGLDAPDPADVPAKKSTAVGAASASAALSAAAAAAAAGKVPPGLSTTALVRPMHADPSDPNTRFGTVPEAMPASEREFTVTPEAADIEPGGVAEFRVAFRPTRNGTAVCQDLEVYVAPKINRSFRLVDDGTMVPPACLRVKAMGHTFAADGAGASFLPKVAASFADGTSAKASSAAASGSSPQNLVRLPPAFLGEPVGYTFQLRNDSDVPATYRVAVEPSEADEGGEAVVRFEPALSHIPLNGTSLVTAWFTPSAPRRHVIHASIRINEGFGGEGSSEPTSVIPLTLVGDVSLPRVVPVPPPTPLSGPLLAALEASGAASISSSGASSRPDVVFIKPTGVGVSSFGTVRLRNTSLVPLRFVARLDTAHSDVLRVSPPVADVEAGEDVLLRVDFSPTRAGEVTAPLQVQVFPSAGSDADATVPVLLARQGAARKAAAAAARRRARPGSSKSRTTAFSGGNHPSSPRALVAAGPSAYAQGEELDLPAAGAVPLQQLMLTVVAFGTAAAVSFSTRHLDLGAAVIGGLVRAPLTLTNNSDSALTFRLDAIVQVLLSKQEAAACKSGFAGTRPEDGGAWEAALADIVGPSYLTRCAASGRTPELEYVEARRAVGLPLPPACEGGSTARNEDLSDMEGEASNTQHQLTYTAGAPAAGPEVEGEAFVRTLALSLADVPAPSAAAPKPSLPGLLSVSPSTGTIPPRSKLDITLAFSPTLPLTCRFRLFCDIVASLDGEAAPPAAAQAATQWSKRAALAAATQAEADSRDPALIDWDAVPRNASSLWCDVVGSGVTPTVIVDDAAALVSREAMVLLLPNHISGFHNAFVAPAAANMPGSGYGEDDEDGEGEGVFDAASVPGGTLAATLTAQLQMATAGAMNTRKVLAGAAAGASNRRGAGGAAGGALTDGEGSGNGAPSAAEPVSVVDVTSLPCSDISPLVKDVWLRGDLATYRPEGLAWGSVRPEAPGWGGWTFSPWPAPALPSPCQPLPSHALWHTMGLARFNHAMQRRLTPGEVAFLTSSDTVRAATAVPVHVCDLPAAPLGSTPLVLALQLRNPTRVPVCLDWVFPSERDVEVERWADIPAPAKQEAGARRGAPAPPSGLEPSPPAVLMSLLERKILDIQPRSARLDPGQALTVRVHYAYGSLEGGGVHHVPVLLRIRHGKTVQLLLRARTLPPRAPLLTVPTAVPVTPPAPSAAPSPFPVAPTPGLLLLEPTPVGLTRPPLHPIPLHNPSAVPVDYAIDPLPFTVAAAAHHGFGVYTLVPGPNTTEAAAAGDPMRGSLGPGEQTTLWLAFNPPTPQSAPNAYDLYLTIRYRARRYTTGGSMLTMPVVDSPGGSLADAWQEGGEESLYGNQADGGEGGVGGGLGHDDATSGFGAEDEEGVDLATAFPKALVLTVRGTGYLPTASATTAPTLVPGAPWLVSPAVRLPPACPHPLPFLDGNDGHLRYLKRGEGAGLPLAAAGANAAFGGAAAADTALVPRGADADLTLLPSLSLGSTAALRARALGGPLQSSHSLAPGFTPSEVRVSPLGNPYLPALVDALAQAVGADALSGAVSTSLNPVDVLTALAAAGGAEGSSAARCLVFPGTGADAVQQAAAAVRLLEALTTLTATSGAASSPSLAAGPSKRQCVTRRGLVVSPSADIVDPFSGSLHRGSEAANASSSEGKGNVLYSLLTRLLPAYGTPSAAASPLWRPWRAPPPFLGAFPAVINTVTPLHVDLPEGFATMSSHWARFGEVPLGTMAHRIVVLRNVRPKAASVLGAGQGVSATSGPISFKWLLNGAEEVTEPAPAAAPVAPGSLSQWLTSAGVLSVHPASGVLQPGEVAVIRVTLAAHADRVAPMSIDADLVCRVQVLGEEMRTRVERTLNSLLRSRWSFRRSKRSALPGGSAPHVSVMNKLTASRANHLHAIAEEQQHKATRILKELEKVVVGGTETARAQKRVVSALTRVSTATAGATRGFLAARQGVNPPVMDVNAAAAATAGPRRSAIGVTAGRSVLGMAAAAGVSTGGGASGSPSRSPSRSPTRSPSPSRGTVSRGTNQTGGGGGGGMISEKDPPLVVSAMLRGDTNVYEGVILNAKEVAAAVAGGDGAPPPRVDMSRVPLPPAPFADLYLRVTARLCSDSEFTQAFTPLHAAAFQKLNGAASGGSPAAPASSSSQAAAVVRGTAAAVVAEVLTQDEDVAAAIRSLTSSTGATDGPVPAAAGTLTVVLPAVANLKQAVASSTATAAAPEKPAPLLTFDALRMTGGSVPAARRLLDTVTHELTKAQRAGALSGECPDAPVGLDAVVDFASIGRPVYDAGVPPPAALARVAGPSLYRLYTSGLAKQQSTTSDRDLEALRDPDCSDFTGKVLASVLLSLARDMVTPLGEGSPSAGSGDAPSSPRTVFDPAVLAAAAASAAPAAPPSPAAAQGGWGAGGFDGAGPGSALGARKSLGRLGGGRGGGKLVHMAVGEEAGEEEDEAAWGHDDEEDEDAPPMAGRRAASVSYQAADGEW